MSPNPLDQLLSQASDARSDVVFASRALQRGVSVYEWEPDRSTDTTFDIASLTKIVCTAASLYRLVSEGHASFDDPVVKFLPNFGQAGKSSVTLRECLGHRSGLPAWAPLFQAVASHEDTRSLFDRPDNTPRPSEDTLRAARALVLEQINRTPLQHAPGTRVYSDFGFITLGAVIEAIVGETLYTWTKEEVFSKIGLKHTTFRPLALCTLDTTIPPTGRLRPRSHAVGQEQLYTIPPQPERSCPGFVDDDNAYAMGGVAGHAGLFSTAADVARFGEVMLQELDGAEQLGKAEVLGEMVTVDPGGSAPLRGLGFDHPSGPTSSTGSRMTRTGPFPTFGHLGFTGCSLWVDPQRRLSISLLSNSTFPYRRSLSAIKTLRPLFHDTLIEFLEPKS